MLGPIDLPHARLQLSDIPYTYLYPSLYLYTLAYTYIYIYTYIKYTIPYIPIPLYLHLDPIPIPYCPSSRLLAMAPSSWWAAVSERARDVLLALVPVAPTDPQLALSAIDVHPMSWLVVGVMLCSSRDSPEKAGKTSWKYI